MLDVHPRHESIHGWRDFFIHLATIAIGLLIALGLEAMVEWAHHRHQVSEIRQALGRELTENHQRFKANTEYFHLESAMLQNNLQVLRYLQLHPRATHNQIPGVLVWNSSHARMADSVWKTANQTGITAFMPQDEVMKTAELYGYFERLDRAHEEEADAIAKAVGYMFQDPDPTHLTPAQVNEEFAFTTEVFSKHLRHGFLMQNLAEQYPDFNPAPTRDELEQLLNLPELNKDATLDAARRLTRKRLDAAAPTTETSSDQHIE